MEMSDQRYFTHRSSVPANIYRQPEQTIDQIQPRSFSVSQTLLQGDLSQAGGQQNAQWHTQRDSLPEGSSVPGQPRQQYSPLQESSQQTKNIHSFISDHVQPVLQNHSSTDGPWTSHGVQQHVPQRFDGDQFRPLGGAATVLPDTRSQPASFNDSAYYSQVIQHKRPAPSDEKQQNFPDQPLLSSHIDQKPPKSVASDSKIQKKSKRPASAKKFFRCTWRGCKKADLKNKSDLRKHLNQHTKPFTCTETGCERGAEGFGTVNDLERHRASVHKLQARCGTTVGYICYACEQNRPVGKWWPRKDNFKSHIGRKHPEWPEDYLITISSRDARPPDARSEIQSAVSYHGEHGDPFEHVSSWNQPQAFQHTNYLASPHGNEGDMLAGGGQWTNSPATQDFSAPLHLPDMSDIDYTQAQAGPSSIGLGMTSAESVGRPAILRTPTLQVTVPLRNVHSQELETLDWNQPAAGPQLQSSSSQTLTQSDGGFTCTRCGVVKRRACDLRKHEKRHTRPYGCTYSGCAKRFGSRNDWKRHEKDQHFLFEQWRCQLPGPEGPACGMLFDRREDMSAHLDSRHGNEGYHHSNPVHCSAIDASHIGKEHYQNFWCGFCDDLVSRKKDGHQHDVDVRIQHIGDHFDKDRLSVEDWIDLEGNRQKCHIVSPRRTIQAMRESSSDASDGGDDGIAGPSSLLPTNARVNSRSTRFKADTTIIRTPYITTRRQDVDDDADGESDHEYYQRLIR